MRFRTDDEAITFDVAALLAAGRFTEALVPAALQADRLAVIPRSLTFLAGSDSSRFISSLPTG